MSDAMKDQFIPWPLVSRVTERNGQAPVTGRPQFLRPSLGFFQCRATFPMELARVRLDAGHSVRDCPADQGNESC